MKYFNNPETLEELKAQYKKLAFENHPDRGGDTETMQEINNEYGELFGRLKNTHKNASGEQYTTEKENAETFDEFIEIISRLVKIPGIIVELCGSWLWVTGDTKAAKEELKEIGFKWSAKKVAWYYHNGEYHKKGSNKTLNEIRAMYGCTRFDKQDEKPSGYIAA